MCLNIVFTSKLRILGGTMMINHWICRSPYFSTNLFEDEILWNSYHDDEDEDDDEDDDDDGDEDEDEDDDDDDDDDIVFMFDRNRIT